MGACYALEIKGRVYVGITTKTAEERFAGHCREARSGRWNFPLYNALRKHGAESVTIHVLAESEDWPTLCAYERMFIALFGSQHRALGYNRTSGGDGVPDLSEEAREKISVATAAASRVRWANDPEYREKMRAKGRERWTDPEYREKMRTISTTVRREQWANDPTYREKMRQANREKKPRALAALYASVEDYGEFTAIGCPDPTDLVDRVRVAVLRSPMNSRRLAKAVGTGVNTIYRFVHREGHPTEPTLRRLAEALGVTDDQTFSTVMM